MPHVSKIHNSHIISYAPITISVLEQWKWHASVLLITKPTQECNGFFNFCVFIFHLQSKVYDTQLGHFFSIAY